MEAVEEQAETGAGADLDERQRPRGQGSQQHGATPDLVRLGAARAHHGRNLGASLFHEVPQLGTACRHALWPGEELDGREEEIGLNHRHAGEERDDVVVLGDRQREAEVRLGITPALPIGEAPLLT